MNKKALQNFLLKARAKTYAGNTGKVKPVFSDSRQFEYKEVNYLYRDIYYVGNGIFAGLETVYFKNKPVLTMSYYGNFKKMTEKEVDGILRKSLIENANTTRIWKNVSWKTGKYTYICETDTDGSIDEFSGTEKIMEGNNQKYFFYYAGGLIVK